MKFKRMLVGCLLIAVIISLCPLGEVQAETNPLVIAVEKGKTYRLNGFLKKLIKFGRVSDAKEIGSKIKKLKKGKGVVLSGKGLTIKKQNFKAKKPGKYKLKLKINKKSYVFSLLAVEKFYQLEQEKITRVVISTKVMGQTTSAEVKDRETIDQIVNKINQAKYSFDFAESMRIRIGFAGYYVSFYAGDGSLVKKFEMGENGVREDKGTYWKAASEECYNYVGSVYNSILSGNTQLSK